jgi:hypothetical protein
MLHKHITNIPINADAPVCNFKIRPLFELNCPWISYRRAFYLPAA